jgi:transcription antitermination factor NusG
MNPQPTWCILRCGDAKTLNLAASLDAEGFSVWVPIEIRRVRVPRMNARVIVREPLLKGFIFADYGQRHDLLRLSERPGRHAGFSVIREFGKVAPVDDDKLDGLRWIEGRVNVAAKKTERSIPDGVTVRVSSGIFSGMTGVVRRSKRGLTLVCFNDRYSAEIPTSLLQTNAVDRFQSATGGPAALAA